MPYRLGLPLVAYPYGPAARFTLTGIQPPASSYLAPSDSLSLSILSPNFPVSFNLALRFLDLQGNVQPLLFEVRAPATGATPTTFAVQTSEGFLLSATASTTTVKRGCCWIQLLVLRTNAADATVIGDALLQGYVSQTDIVSYPGTQEKTSIGGRGCMREILVPAAAAGTPLTLTVPPATRWRPVSVGSVITFTTGGNFATLRILDAASNRLIIAPSESPLNGSPTFASWFLGSAFGSQLFAQLGGLADELYLSQGFVMSLQQEQAFDPATVFGPARFIVEEWAELQ